VCAPRHFAEKGCFDFAGPKRGGRGMRDDRHSVLEVRFTKVMNV
jgi:hypothetical protein